MTAKIHKRLLAIATLSIAVTLLLMVAVCYNIIRNQAMEDLRVYAQNAAQYLSAVCEDDGEDGGREDLIESVKRLANDNVRMTLIAPDGTVIYDSEATVSEMENHSDRPEVSQALTVGEGSFIRRSDTLEINTYYYAILLSNGDVLRVARDVANIYRVMEYAVPYLLVGIALLLIICFAISRYIALDIMEPVRKIAEDVENIDRVESYEELRPYVDAIKREHEAVIENAKLRQEFTANVSHELKTPLTAISGYAELMENGMVSEESEVRRFAGEIHHNAGRLLTLINDVIRLSELDDSESEEVFERVDLWELASNCVAMLQLSAEKHNVTLTLEGERAFIKANKQMVDEVLYNLCDNAIRYNKEGGSVIVRVSDRLNNAVLAVKDTGIGIPKEHQERVFERFYRVDKSRSKQTGGTGLGLAIVKHIVMHLGAEMNLESTLGKGTTITITFPADKTERFR